MCIACPLAVNYGLNIQASNNDCVMIMGEGPKDMVETGSDSNPYSSDASEIVLAVCEGYEGELVDVGVAEIGSFGRRCDGGSDLTVEEIELDNKVKKGQKHMICAGPYQSESAADTDGKSRCITKQAK